MIIDGPNIPAGWTVSNWTREQAESMGYNARNTYPIFDLNQVKPLDPDYDVWDSWLVLTEEGTVADVGGYNVLIALGAPVGESSSAKLMYFYSRTDENRWVSGGNVFEDNLIDNSQEWSGSTIWTSEGELQFFYTIAQSYQDPETGIYQTDQRFATAKVPVDADDGSFALLDPSYHELLAWPDGYFYQTVEGAVWMEKRFPTQHRRDVGSDQVNNFTFRDPHYFKDPATGEEYLLFEGNTGDAVHAEGIVRDEYIGAFADGYQPSADDLKANGCVGVIRLGDERTSAELLPPLLTSNLVTDEIERINVIVHDNRYYLFIVTHGNKMTVSGNDLINRDFMIGFVSDTLFGAYEPLNDTGIVITQKSPGDPYVGQEQNEQYVYSWLVVPTAGRYTVIAYSNYSTLDGETVRIKSSAPSVELLISGDRTRLGRILGYFEPAEEDEEE